MFGQRKVILLGSADFSGTSAQDGVWGSEDSVKTLFFANSILLFSLVEIRFYYYKIKKITFIRTTFRTRALARCILNDLRVSRREPGVKRNFILKDRLGFAVDSR